MVRSCAVFGCSNRSNRESDKKYFCFPGIRDRRGRPLPEGALKREKWIAALRRKGFTYSKYATICSDHFLSGYPSDDPRNPDFIPSVKMGYDTAGNNVAKKARYDRYRQRKQLIPLPSTSTSSSIATSESVASIESVASLSSSNTTPENEKSTQTDEEYAAIMDSLIVANKTIMTLRSELSALNNCAEAFAANDEKTIFFTGVNYKTLEMIMGLIYTYLPAATISPFQLVVLSLMRVRLNLSFRYLGYHFNIHETTVSRLFYKTINVLYKRLKNFIIWPSRDELMNRMPVAFQEVYGRKVAVIIDCFEVKIEKSRNLQAKCSTWSSYKHDNTFKVLIGVTPQGSISFISKCYGGRISDKKITENCGILENLLPGDVVLADRGFLIEELVKIVYGADVKTPAFVKGRRQLECSEVESSRRLSSLRIHVERVIGVLRQKYQLFHHTVPITMLKKSAGEVAMIDQILTVCAALVNLCPSIVPQ